MELIWTYVKKYKKLLFFALGLAAINQLFSLVDPQLFRIIIDKYATDPSLYTQSEFARGVGLLLLGIVGVAFVSRTAKAFQDYYVNVVTQTVGTRMYAESVQKVFDLPFDIFEDERSGSILLNLQKARDDARNFIASAINVVFLSVVGIIFVIAYAFYVHWAIALTFLVLIPVVASITYMLSKRIKEAQKEIVLETADLSGSTTETLRNVGLVKSLGLEKQEVDRLNKTNEKVLDLELKKVVLVRKLVFIQGTIVNAVRTLILFVTLYLLWFNLITLGEFMIFTFYVFYIFNPLYSLSEVVSQYQEAQASTAELARILALSAGVYDTGKRVFEDINELSFENMSFRYRYAEGSALDQVSLSFPKGKVSALVGPSGSGKSTIVKLLVGLYRPTEGAFKINGVPAEEIDFNAFRQKVGLVTQETQLFSGTIRDNLTFIKPDARDEDLVRILEDVSLEYLLERGDARTGRGLDAKIGETGIKLSGGERQRLAIARALLRNPDVLIFDEATSALDSITESRITEMIRGIRERNPDLIMIIVAHRLSTIVHADSIYVMAKGSVVEEGHHSSLVTSDGLYSALWKEQTAQDMYN